MVVFSIFLQEDGSQLNSSFVLLYAFLKINFVLLILETTLLKKHVFHY